MTNITFILNNLRGQWNRRGQHGDTLVEVLICILIVTVILTGAYVTTSKSSLGVRNSQEHSEALKLVQSQLEQIRQNASNASGAPVFTMSPPFCMIDGGPTSTTITPGLAGCVQNSGGSPALADSRYKMSVDRTDCGSSLPSECKLFVVTATWESITAKGNATEKISYRLYK